MSDPTLRELLGFCFTAPAYSLLPWQVERLVDVAESAVSELLTSDATVERVARALAEERVRLMGWAPGQFPDLVALFAKDKLPIASTACAALAAALASEGEASDAH